MLSKLVPIQYICMLFLFLFLNSSCNQTTHQKHILIIQSYENGFPGYKEIKKIFAEQLQERDIKAEVHSLYLDCTATILLLKRFRLSLPE